METVILYIIETLAKVNGPVVANNLKRNYNKILAFSAPLETLNKPKYIFPISYSSLFL